MASSAQIKANRENAKKAGRNIATATLQAQLFRESLAQMITDEAQEWKDAIGDVAKGHWVMKENEDGTTRTYKKSPDPHAWEKAMDRAFGKPKQELEVQEKPDEETQGRLEGLEAEMEALAKEYNQKIIEKLKQKK